LCAARRTSRPFPRAHPPHQRENEVSPIQVLRSWMQWSVEIVSGIE
jgi:hypothetical protein